MAVWTQGAWIKDSPRANITTLNAQLAPRQPFPIGTRFVVLLDRWKLCSHKASVLSQNNRSRRREHAARPVRQRNPRSLHLSLTAFIAQLSRRLDQQENAIHPWVAVGKP